MSLYNNFIGLDIGKYNFVVAIYGNKQVGKYENNKAGIESFISDYKLLSDNSLSVLETCGGYEIELLFTLYNEGFAVHRANARKVKNFIRSYGNGAKTDSLDAKALALYGFERKSSLELFIPQTEKALELYELVQRRNDLKQILVAEKNRVQAPTAIGIIKTSAQLMVKVISEQIAFITTEIDALIKDDPILTARKKALMSIAGIGNIVANELLILLPELGKLNRKQIASLAGLAPCANDSGKFSGYRRTGHGRSVIKPILFLAAMAARNSNSQLSVFYRNLINRGKKKMVALVALMRKIIVIANAKLHDLYASNLDIKI
jgi:transposase